MALSINNKERLCDYLQRQPQIMNQWGNEQITQEQIQFLTNGQTFVLPKNNERILFRICSEPQLINLHASYQLNKPFNLENDIILLNKLIKQNIPIGGPLAICEDNQIFGHSFYIREQKQGRIFTQETVQQLSGPERRELFQEIIRVLGRLHNINAFDLQSKEFNYEEKLQSLENLYKNNETKIQGNIENLLYWLKLNIPKTSFPQTLCIGQIGLNNFVFHSTDIKIIDILHLDQIHLGSPMMELASFLTQYDTPYIKNITDHGIKNTYKLLNFPSKTELINQYFIDRNLNIISNLSYYSIFILLAQAVENQVFIKRGKTEKSQILQQKLEVLSNASWDLILDLTENDPFQIRLRSETDSYLWSKYPVSDRCKSYYYRIRDFMREEVFPLEKSQFDLLYGRQGEAHWQGLPGIEHLQQRAKSMGLWNLFISDPVYGKGLTNLEYAFLSELMGMSFFGHEIFNCYAPETGNIKLLIMAGTEQQKQKYLKPLLEGSCKTFFTMSEKNVASSDPTNFETTIMKQGDGYIINGSKWMVSGIQDNRCKFGIIMGKTKLDQKSPFTEQSMFLIDYPNPNIILKSPLQILGFDEAPHGVCEVEFNNVYVPKENMLGKEGSAFAMAQGRLLGGRLHHSVRLLGLARRCIDVLLERGQQRIHKNKKQKEDSAFQEKVGRIETDFIICRTMILNAAMILDSLGGRHMSSLKAVSETKAFVPFKCQCIVDQCIQLFGAEGVTTDQILQICYLACRGIRLMDGPCELHLKQVARFSQGNHLFNELVECDGYINAKL